MGLIRLGQGAGSPAAAKAPNPSQRIRELEDALRHEREARTWEHRARVAAEEALRRAIRVSLHAPDRRNREGGS